MSLSDNEDDAFASINKYLDQVEKAMDEPEVDDGSGFTRPASAGSGPKRAFEEPGTDDERQLVRRSTASRARWRSVGRDAVRDRERSRLVQDLDKKATLQREKMKVCVAKLCAHKISLHFLDPSELLSSSSSSSSSSSLLLLLLLLSLLLLSLLLLLLFLLLLLLLLG